MMQFEYEVVKHNKGLPFKVFFASINSREYHWHSDLELIWQLKGSIRLQLSDGDILLNRGDVYLLNTNEVHCIRHTEEDNLLLAIQINESILGHYFESFSNISFANQYLPSDNELALFIKKQLAIIMSNLMKGGTFDLIASVGGLHLLLSRLIKEVPYKKIDKQINILKQNDLERLKRIIAYINEHFREKISLGQLADTEYLSKYHLSHFIKNKLGIGFQEFVNRLRVEAAVTAIINTNEKILDISEYCGFSDVKYLNKLLKEEYQLTGKQLRRHYKEQVPQMQSYKNKGHLAFSEEEAIAILKTYL
jgi:xylan 1,4-beta-xylosidase